MDAARFVIVGALGVAVWAGWASIPLLAIVAFVLGAGQTLFESAAQSFIPALVGRDRQRLERANSRLFGAQQVSQQLTGPPLGGALFALARAVPFVVDAVSFAASSALIAAIPGRFASQRPADAVRASLRAEIAQGVRWLLGHRLVRTIVVMNGVTNLALTAGDAILVLFAQQHLGLGSVGYGLLLAGYAVGGVLGSLVAVRVSRLVGTGTITAVGVVGAFDVVVPPGVRVELNVYGLLCDGEDLVPEQDLPPDAPLVRVRLVGVLSGLATKPKFRSDGPVPAAPEQTGRPTRPPARRQGTSAANEAGRRHGRRR